MCIKNIKAAFTGGSAKLLLAMIRKDASGFRSNDPVVQHRKQIGMYYLKDYCILFPLWNVLPE